MINRRNVKQMDSILGFCVVFIVCTSNCCRLGLLNVPLCLVFCLILLCSNLSTVEAIVFISQILSSSIEILFFLFSISLNSFCNINSICFTILSSKYSSYNILELFPFINLLYFIIDIDVKNGQ